MGRPKDTFNSYSTEGEKDGKAIKKCIFCGHPFSKDGSVTRIKAHLGNVKGRGVAPCAKVPSDVKKAAKNALPSSSGNTLNTNIPSNSEMQQPSPQIMQSAPEQSPRLPDGSLQQSNVDPMDVQPDPLLQDTTQQPPPQRSGASGPPPQNMLLDIPMQQDNDEPFDSSGMGTGVLGHESPIEMTSLSEGDHLFLSTFFNDPQSSMNQMALNDPQPDESCSMQLESLHTVHQLQREQDAPWIDSAHGTSTPQDILTKPWLEVPEMPPYNLQHNESCSTHGSLASQHPRKQGPREYHNHLPHQVLLQGAAGMDLEYDAAIPQNLLQGGACPDSLPDFTHQDDMAVAQFGNHEGQRAQNHTQENLQGDQRIISLDHDPYTSIEQQLHPVNTNPLPESSDTPKSTSDQANRNKRKLGKHPIGRKLPMGTLIKGSTFNCTVDQICEFLEDNSVSKIGIYGMGGCGKTMIMKHIHNQLLEGCFMSYSHVIWVRLPQDHTISVLQKRLAHALDVKLSPDEDEGGDAWAVLLHEKMQNMTYALVLDNVWNKINLAEVGIPKPTPMNGCKVILTTRSLDVCKEMECKCIELDVLPEQEAWDLFVKILNVDPRESSIQDIMEKVVKKCAGLPLAVATIAESMRSANHDHEWENALNHLSSCSYRFIDKEEEIMKSLKFSYDRLEKPLQKCLLNCALYPEDIEIEKDKLIELLIMEGTIGTKEGRKSAYDLGQTILDKLERASLLTCHYFYGFVMHDLIRGMCLNIMGNRFVVKSPSKSPPDLSEYSEDVEKVSLMKSKFEEIPSQMVKRPKLSTLLLSDNRYLSRISGSFFEGLPGLKVLNLSNTSMEELPSSVTNLLSLNALVLRRCRNLRCLPRIAPLKALKQLDLYATAIREAPEGLEELVNLTYLDLNRTYIEQVSSSILTNLVKLQHLKLPDGTKIMMKDVKKLKKLQVFKANFANWEEFVEYVNNGQALSEYEIKAELPCLGASCASMSYKISRDKKEGNIEAVLSLREDHYTIGENQLSNEVIGQIPSPEIVQSLNLRGFSKWKTKENGELKGICGAIVFFPFSNLVELSISYFDFTMDLISASSSVVESSSSLKVLPCFQNLQEIEIYKCRSLESIIVSTANPTEKEESNNPISFPKLRKLTLEVLPNLRSICDGALICPSIEDIRVYECPKLKRLPLQLPPPPVLDNNYNSGQLSLPPPLSSLKEIRGQWTWWKSLEWDQPHAKPLLQPYFKSI